jgi:5-methyltetrahydrofolate--homocysteine methyltransferase
MSTRESTFSIQDLQQAVIDGEAPRAKALTEAAVKAGADPQTVLRSALIPAMDIVGERMRNGDYYVPEVLVAARAMHWALDVLKPMLASSGVKPTGVAVMATVRGDLHDIGKNLVVMMMEGAGFQIVDLGTDVPPQRIVEAVREHRPQLVGMSALLTTTMPSMKAAMDELVAAGLRQSIKVMVGGAPLTTRYADEIGADGYAPDAASAVSLAKRLMGV